MKKTLIIFVVLAFAVLCEAKETSLFDGISQQRIIVNNRILARPNGKPISVIDIMKKMDMQFYQQYPQYTSSVQARHQYYLANWKSVLAEMIDRELILVDAEEAKIEVSAGDVRQEMEELFGPNIIANLDKAGLTFNEAYQMVLDDIIIRRMLYFRVQSKAINKATPQRIRDFYDQISKDHVRDNEWIFNVITIRHRDGTKAAETANLVYHLLAEDKVPLNELMTKLEEIKATSPKHPKVNISEEFHTYEKELSEVYKKTLVELPSNSYSMPIAQKSRSDNSTVFRIFYLKNMVQGGVIPYHELEARIKNKLINDAISVETEAYFKKQRQHFDVQDSQTNEIVNSDFQPFILK